jgi:hypothetical protein
LCNSEINVENVKEALRNNREERKAARNNNKVLPTETDFIEPVRAISNNNPLRSNYNAMAF